MIQSRIDFIKKYRQDVINSVAGTGLFPSVAMAQFIIESSDSNGNVGKGITFVKANNGFGIKADSKWTGQKMSFSTPNDASKTNYFRVYPTVADSIEDHAHFLKHNSRYRKAGVFDATTVPDQLIALQNSGYSESPNYAALLAKIIRDYDLEDMDKMPVKLTPIQAQMRSEKKKVLGIAKYSTIR